MKKPLIILFLLFIVKSGFTQNKNMDALLAKLPLINGKLIYNDSISLSFRNVTELNSTAKKWIDSNFKYHRLLPSTGKDTANSLLVQSAVEFSNFNSFKVVKYGYYLIMTIQIKCRNNSYSYKISDMYIVLKSKFLNSMVNHPTTPEYIIDMYKKKKHYFWTGFTQNNMKEYLSNINTSALNCIASLKKAMETP